MTRNRPTSVRPPQVFCVAARHSSFKLAAQQLFLTPSAVSHRVRELETSLGVDLFERRTRGLALTDAGRTLYGEVEPLLQAVEASVDNVTQRLKRPRLRVTAPQFFASEALIPRLPGFSQRWPLVDVQIDSTSPRPDEHAPDADVSILLSGAAPEGVRAIALLELHFVAVCAPEYRAALGPIDGRLPPDAALLIHRSWPDAWQRWSADTGIELPRGTNFVAFDTMFSLLRAAEHGLGIALVAPRLGEAWLEYGALIRLDPANVAIGDTYWFAARERDLHRAEVRAFRDWIIMEFAAQPEEISSRVG